MKLQFPVLQGVHKVFNDSKGLCHLGLVPCADLEGPIRLEFVRTFIERLPQAFTKLQLGFALRRITIRKSFLANVFDCRQNLLKLIDSVRDFLDESDFRSGPLIFRWARSCHGCVKKV